jgi:exosortase
MAVLVVVGHRISNIDSVHGRTDIAVRKKTVKAAYALAIGLVMVVLLGLLFWPTLTWLVSSWLGNPYYSHGFLVPLIVGGLVWRQRNVLAKPQPNDAGLVLIVAGLAVYLAAVFWKLNVVSAYSLIVVLAGLIWMFWGSAVLRRLAFPLVFLAVAIPLPWIEQISPPLEAFVANYATQCAKAVGVAATNVGSQVNLTGTTFVVGAPCSGLQSLVALFTLTLLFSYLVNGPAWARVLLVIAALPAALLANLVRIFSLFWVADLFGVQAGFSYYHNLSSPVLFLIAFGLLIALSRCLHCSEIRLLI